MKIAIEGPPKSGKHSVALACREIYGLKYMEDQHRVPYVVGYLNSFCKHHPRGTGMILDSLSLEGLVNFQHFESGILKNKDYDRDILEIPQYEAVKNRRDQLQLEYLREHSLDGGGIMVTHLESTWWNNADVRISCRATVDARINRYVTELKSKGVVFRSDRLETLFVYFSKMEEVNKMEQLLRRNGLVVPHVEGYEFDNTQINISQQGEILKELLGGVPFVPTRFVSNLEISTSD